MSGIFWTVIVFTAVGIFIVVGVYRVAALARQPVHLRWELAPVLRHSLAAMAGYMAREILFFRGVWRRNRSLWPFSFSLHAGVYLFFLVLLLIIVDALLLLWGAPAAGRGVFEGVVSWLALAAYLLGGAGALSLILKRVLDANLRPFSTISSYFNLALLAVVFISGAYGWFSGRAFVPDLGLFTRGLVTPAGAAAPSLAVALHVVLTLLFLIYLPFSDMFHFAAKFFTYHEVRWDDRPLTPKMENELAYLLSRPAGWSAPHVAADASKTWMDIIVKGKDEKEAHS